MKNRKKRNKQAAPEGLGTPNYIVEVGPNADMADDAKPIMVDGLRTYHQGDSPAREDARRIAESISRFDQVDEIRRAISEEEDFTRITYHFQKPVYLRSVDELDRMFNRYIPIVGPDVIIVTKSLGSNEEREFASWSAEACKILSTQTF